MSEITSSVLSFFETDKQQRKSFVDNVLMQLSEGSVDALKVHLQLKCMEDVCEQIKADAFYKNNLLDEAAKNGKKFMYQNAEFQIKEAGVKYDYSQCNDPELSQMLQDADALNKKVKVRQEMLKNAPTTGLELLVGDEVVTVYPPAKSSTTTVQVTLK